MTQVLPACIIPCCDVWPPGTLGTHKMQAYKALQADGAINRLHVTYSKDSGITVLEYYSGIPHDWTRDELRKRAAQILHGQ